MKGTIRRECSRELARSGMRRVLRRNYNIRRGRCDGVISTRI
jgi:hypothetical protein